MESERAKFRNLFRRGRDALPTYASLKELLPLRRFHKSRQPVVWLVALAVGVVVGYAALGFLMTIRGVQALAFGGSGDLAAIAAALPWWQVLMIPAAGGLVIGIFMRLTIDADRPLGVPEIIEARALHGGRVSFWPGVSSALISASSLGAGASGGREGPMVHLGGTLAALATRRLGYSAQIGRLLLGCGVAAAVSASFNAPLAGVLFAHEVVLGHYALRAIAPITIASAAGATVARIHLGDTPAFSLPDMALGSYWETPAFVITGLLGAFLAVAFMQAVAAAERGTSALPLPLWARPALGGLLVGGIALAFPQVLGVGYETTARTLHGEYGLAMLLALVAAKLAATAVTLASRFGGGVFSPSVLLGALMGAAFGVLLAAIAPATSGADFYALVGMGSVSAAVLGAPLSTTLIVFELTRDYQVTFALLISASIATVVTQSTFGASFFQLQLLNRGLDLRFGPQASLLRTLRVENFMEKTEGPAVLTPGSTVLHPETTLEEALDTMQTEGVDDLPVVRRDTPDEVIAIAHYTAALQLYNKHLVQAHVEEHR
ncbi:MAG: chloride channel protein [Alphaproteobacteria bacterium]